MGEAFFLVVNVDALRFRDGCVFLFERTTRERLRGGMVMRVGWGMVLILVDYVLCGELRGRWMVWCWLVERQ